MTLSSLPAGGVDGAITPPAGMAIRVMLDLSHQILCVCDLDGRIMWVNKGFELAVGQSGQDLDGRFLDEILDPQDRFIGSLLTELAAGGADGRPRPSPSKAADVREVTGTTARIRSADGGTRWVEWTVRASYDRALLFAAGRDVTEWREADAAIRTAEEQLRGILAFSPSAIYVRDVSGQLLLANEEWRRLYEDPQNASTAQDSVSLAGVERAVIEGGAPVESDIHLHTRNVERDLMLTVSPLVDESGQVYAVCGIASDITNRKMVERSMRSRERVLSSVLSASPDIISLMDSNGRIHQISSAEEAILGHSSNDPVGRDLFPLVHPDDFDEVASAFIRMVTGSASTLHVRYRMMHADGHWVTVDSRGQAVVDGEGRFVGAVVVSREISDRLASEQRLEAIRQAAERASRAKSEFLSRMSHELRTPLNAILGFSQLLEMDELPMQQADAVGHILRAGRHLLELINEVLDIARIEAGHLDLALVPVDLDDIARESVELTRTMAERADISVRVDADPAQGLAAMADRQRLLQVLLNLVSNGIKYNRTGGRVDVSCSVDDEAGTRVRIAVADTGYGIRPDRINRVFEPFDRLGVEQFGVEGTGVGLSLSKHLVEQMGGTVEFDSVQDVGSTFVVRLPIAVVSGGARRHGASSRTEGGTRPRFTVLLVEQNLSSLEMVERVLSRRPGVTVLAAMHGRLGLDLARENRPDLVLLDAQLPDMSGAMMLERLEEDPVTAGIPVALLTTEGQDTQARRTLGRGVAGQVAKPIDVRALLSLVDAVRATTGK